MDPLYRQEIPMPFRGIERASLKKEPAVKKEEATDINVAETKLAYEKEGTIEEIKNADIKMREREASSRGGLDMRLLALLLLLYSD
ncbi:MAG: hypothetical protein VB120_07625 [Lachnospiraceae bacterium]|nr:hypothetical protein [Lachnospiraceae bacterium]